MVSKKPRTLAADDSDSSDNDELYQAIDRLEELQKQLKKVNAKAREKIKKIERKYKEIRDPVYARRNDIINRIPNFWLTVFLRHPVLEDMLTDYDLKIFRYLDSLNVEDFPDPKKGYRITFTFKDNPYFENPELTKTITFSDDGTLTSVGTCIFWMLGQGPKVKRNNEASGSKRPLPFQSFFNWISDPPEDLHLDMVAEIIKEDIWPNPIGLLNNGENENVDDADDDEDEDDDEEDDSSSS